MTDLTQEAICQAEVQSAVECVKDIEEHVGPMSQQQKGEVLNLILSLFMGVVGNRKWAGMDFPESYGLQIRKAVKEISEAQRVRK